MTDKQHNDSKPQADLVSEVEELLEKHERVDAVTLTRSCKWNDHKGCVRDWCCCVCHDKFEELAPDLLRRLVGEVKRLRRGEFICQRCYLRKDAEFERGDF